MYCINCGAENPDGAIYCNSCGSKVNERSGKHQETPATTPPQTQPPVQKETPAGQKIAGIVIGIIIFVIILFAIGLGSTSSSGSSSGCSAGYVPAIGGNTCCPAGYPYLYDGKCHSQPQSSSSGSSSGSCPANYYYKNGYCYISCQEGHYCSELNSHCCETTCCASGNICCGSHCCPGGDVCALSSEGICCPSGYPYWYDGKCHTSTTSGYSYWYYNYYYRT